MSGTQGHPTYSAIGQLIRQARLRKNVSAGQLASATGVSRAFVSRVERGLQKPSADFLRACAECLGAPEFHHLALGLSRDPHQPEPEPYWEITTLQQQDDLISPIELAERFRIPIPWADLPPGRRHSRLPPTLAALLSQLAEEADAARTLAHLYNRAVAKHLPDSNAREALASLVREVARLKFAEGATRGIHTALNELKSAGTYALYWALVPFLPPPHALWLHQVHSALASASYPPDLQRAVLELTRLLAAVPPMELQELLPRLRSLIRERLAGQPEQTPAPAEIPTGRVPFHPRPDLPNETEEPAPEDEAPAVPDLENILSAPHMPDSSSSAPPEASPLETPHDATARPDTGIHDRTTN